jgi:exonuclease SbcC
MRPIKLTISAFGPYAGTQVFDFRELDGRDFFLIHGPTGAGKTTVLDAICYALYGDTSGADRDGKSMRCDLAAPGEMTEVGLDFTLGTELYRIHRQPEQERPKLRGTGTTTAQQEVTLWHRTGCAEGEEGKVLASRWREAGEEIERLLGFRSDQFRQVVMLPQGKFRELLSAGSQERQEILEVLFRTELYRRIEVALKDAARGLGKEIEEEQQRRAFLLQQAEAESPDELAERRAELAERLAALEESARELVTAHTATEERLAEGRRTADKLREREEWAAALATLLARGDEIAASRQILDRARRAAELADAERARDERAREEVTAAQQLAKAEGEHEVAEAGHTAAREALQRETDRGEEREAARREASRLEALASQIAELTAAGKAVERAGHAVTTATKAYDAAASVLTELTRRTDEATKEREEIYTLAQRVDLLAREARDAEQRVVQCRRLDDARRKEGAATGKVAEARAELAAAQEAAATARTAQRELQATWIAGQATVLARSLAEGEPCPVCGAAHHPTPAAADGAVPTQEELDSAAALIDEADRALEQARARESGAAQTLALLGAEVGRLTEELGELASTAPAALEEEAEAARIRHAGADAARARVVVLDELLAELKTKRVTAEATLEEASADRTATKEDESTARAILAEREAGIPESLRDPKILEETRAQAVEALRILDQALDQARELEATTRAALEGSRQTLSASRTAATGAAERARKAREEFGERLTKAGFTGEAEAEYAAAKRSPTLIATLDSEIRRYDLDLHAARANATRAEEAARDLVAPDLPALEAAQIEAARLVQECTAAKAKTQEHLTRIEKWLADLEAVAQKAAALEERYGTLGSIADVANGQNPHRTTFQRYVLGALLDDVLLAASARLRIMSRGRYTLQRAHDHTDRRRARGLDLEVDDAYTGKARPVSTLSGGEGFVASLALALGLADVVQSYAGGIHLETIFVDEGFGTLDPESLDLALRALIDLQQGGRLVGIISHVPELRDQIDARLEVTTGRDGSTARFVVG